MKSKSLMTIWLSALTLLSCANSSTPSVPSINVPSNDFHTERQYQYCTDPDWRNISSYAVGVEELSLPRSLSLPLNPTKDAPKYYVQIAKGKADFAGVTVRETTQKSYEFYNAELGETYYYRSSSSMSDLSSARVHTYQVASLAPRNLYVDGMTNFRDIGGWSSSLIEGGTIRQGLFFRSANPDSVSSKGLETIRELGVTVDIDMRDADQIPETSALSHADYPVKLVNASIPSGTEARRYEEFDDVYKLIFETIAQADKNPIVLHCAQGADRTGIVSFFLLALCGANVEECGRDYCWTNFSTQGVRDPKREFDVWVKKTKENYAEFPTFADQMKAHLLSKGLEESTLEHIREIFVPGYESK